MPVHCQPRLHCIKFLLLKIEWIPVPFEASCHRRIDMEFNHKRSWCLSPLPSPIWYMIIITSLTRLMSEMQQAKVCECTVSIWNCWINTIILLWKCWSIHTRCCFLDARSHNLPQVCGAMECMDEKMINAVSSNYVLLSHDYRCCNYGNCC